MNEKTQQPDGSKPSPKKQVERLHALFGDLTGRRTHVRWHERQWFELLRLYGFDAESLQDDVRLLVRYLLRQIDKEKRNPGSLKLSNFLQPDKFSEDVAEAKVVLKVKRPRPQRASVRESEEQPLSDEEFAKKAVQFKTMKAELQSRLRESNPRPSAQSVDSGSEIHQS